MCRNDDVANGQAVIQSGPFIELLSTILYASATISSFDLITSVSPAPSSGNPAFLGSEPKLPDGALRAPQLRLKVPTTFSRFSGHRQCCRLPDV
jgi:hypothetical protein